MRVREGDRVVIYGPNGGRHGQPGVLIWKGRTSLNLMRPRFKVRLDTGEEIFASAVTKEPPASRR